MQQPCTDSEYKIFKSLNVFAACGTGWSMDLKYRTRTTFGKQQPASVNSSARFNDTKRDWMKVPPSRVDQISDLPLISIWTAWRCRIETACMYRQEQGGAKPYNLYIQSKAVF